MQLRPSASSPHAAPASATLPPKPSETGDRPNGLAPDRLTLSTGRKLAEANGEALKSAGHTVLDAVRHPLRTIGASFTGMWTLVRHPAQVWNGVATRFKQDRLDAVLQGASLASGYVGILGLGLFVGALAAAPFTAGASLSLLPLAGTLGTVSGIAGCAAMGFSLFKNESDVARASTPQELARERGELAQDFGQLALTLATYGAGKGVGALGRKLKPQNVNPAAAQRALGRIRSPRRQAGASSQPGGPSVKGLTRGQLRDTAVREVREALDSSAQGPRTLRVDDLDLGSLEKFGPSAERRLAYHGTREAVRPLIRQNGFKSSEIGDYGSGIYLGSSAKTGVSYADDVTLGRGLRGQEPAVFVAEVAPGKVFNWAQQKDAFLEWAKAHCDPTDMSNPLNQAYARPNVPVSSMVDNTWTRFLPQYCRELGYDSVLVPDWDGPGLDYWVIHDPSRIALRQEITLDPPLNDRLVPRGLAGTSAPGTERGQAQQERKKR